MTNNNLSNATPIRLTQEQNKALEKLKHIGFKRSSIIRLAINEYLKNNFCKMIADSQRIKTPF